MGVTVASLMLLLLFGIERFGSTRTLIGGSVQPSQPAKVVIVIYVAAWLASKGDRIRNVRVGLLPFSVLLGFLTFLVVLQPSISTAVLIVATASIMFFIAGAALGQLLFVAVALGDHLLARHQVHFLCERPAHQVLGLHLGSDQQRRAPGAVQHSGAHARRTAWRGNRPGNCAASRFCACAVVRQHLRDRRRRAGACRHSAGHPALCAAGVAGPADCHALPRPLWHAAGGWAYVDAGCAGAAQHGGRRGVDSTDGCADALLQLWRQRHAGDHGGGGPALQHQLL